jgi:hypothetical protein
VSDRGVLLAMEEQKFRRILEQENARLEAKIAELLTLLVSDKRRRIYSPDSPRDKSGRVLGTCEWCHTEGVVLVGQGWCRTCYGRWYRHHHPRPQRLGSAPLVSLVSHRYRGR